MKKFCIALFAASLVTMAVAQDSMMQHPKAPPAKSPSFQPKLPVPTKPAPLTPLSPRERALQLLNRFTFGPRPGDIEHILALTPEKWLEQQLNPASISDVALERRLNDYPTLNLQPDQALTLFPDRGMVQQVAEGKRPYPADASLAAMYQVQVYKYNQDLDIKKINANGQLTNPPLSDAELAARKKQDQATAARIAGDLFTLSKNQRMAALLQLSLPDRIAFTTYVAGDQKNLLLADFTPRERELFNGMAANVGASYQIVSELSQAKLVRAILSERQLQEIMTDFWFNHFNIFIGKDSDQWYTTTYERDDIRKHALGKFRDLLLATATSPAMMVYLDNWLSIGPDSLANGVDPANPNSKKGNRGLNENYGREVMELHTVGVNGGYTQSDVTSLSAILTGWSVDRPNQGGPFLYDPKKHQPGTKTWLKYTIDEQGNVTIPIAPATKPNARYSAAAAHVAAAQTTIPTLPSLNNLNTPEGMKQGIAALTALAASPQTAHFISFKLAQRFVADEPPTALVDRLAATYLASDGDIKVILRALIQSPEFNSKKYFRNKVKTPTEFIASAFRTTATDPQNPGALVNTLKTMGMPLYYALPPTGYYITADQWMNSTALVDRLNFAYQLTSNKFANQKFDSPHLLALGLMSQPAESGSGQQQQASITEPVSSPHPVEASRSFPLSSASGSDVALHVLEATLIGGEVSSQTNQLIHQQIDKIPATNPTDTLNLLTALVMGSPEFQLR